MRALLFLVSLLILAAAASASAFADCPLDLGHGTGLVVFSEHFIIAVRPDPAVIEVGEPIALILNVCTKGGDAAELMGIDARLDDQHVVGKVPTIIVGDDGRYRAEGLMFNAPGFWEVGFSVRRGAFSERLSHDLVVKK
jgi:hypothetical protein